MLKDDYDRLRCVLAAQFTAQYRGIRYVRIFGEPYYGPEVDGLHDADRLLELAGVKREEG